VTVVLVGQRSSVQDEQVEAVVILGEAGREGRGLLEGREIREVGLDRGACRGGDLAAGAFGARRVAPDDADVRAQRAIDWAAARPRPEVAPVTIATLPSRPRDCNGAQLKRRRRVW
jgi:hypothetical protein